MLAVAAVVLAAGCSKDPLADVPGGDSEGTGGTITATFELTRDFEVGVEVKADGSEDMTIIRNVWVIQMAPDGSKLLQAPIYVSSLTDVDGDYRVESDMQKAPCKIVFVANTHDAAAYSKLTLASTEADVAAVAKTVKIPGDVTIGTSFPMSGTWSGTPNTTIGVPDRVSMSRSVAKVTFNLGADLPAGHSFEVLNLQLKQVPATLCYYRSDEDLDSYPYPDLAKAKTIDYPYQFFTDVKFEGGGISPDNLTVMWHIPENVRGMGTAEDQFHKTAGTAPTGQGDYCTYVEVLGIYTVPVGLTKTAYYRIFLGANNTDDYNLRRNTHYTVNTTIKGWNASDTRVTKTEINYLDYTDNDSPMFAVNIEDENLSKSMIWDEAVNVCHDGWRLPTQREMMSMWVFKNGLRFLTTPSNRVYWTSTEDFINPIYMLCVDIMEGTLSDVTKKDNVCYVRCIRSDNYVPSGVRYPYVTSAGSTSGQASVIVSRDAAGGAKTACIHPNWTASTMPADYSENVATNAVSARFEVAAADLPEQMAWADALTGCAGYTQAGTSAGDWRVPTQRELMLVWVMLPSTEFTFETSFWHWSSTRHRNSALHAWGQSFLAGAMSSYKKISTAYVRCVRDF